MSLVVKGIYMLNQIVFNELKREKRSSFAIWALKNSMNPKDVSDLSQFSNFEAIKGILKPHIIFVAMNLASDGNTDMLPFSNFHSSVIKHNDFRLRDAIVGSPFEGAYMTDMFDYVSSSSRELSQYYNNNTNEKEKSIRRFISNCRFVYGGTKYVISIGVGYHYKTICEYIAKEEDFVCLFANAKDKYKPGFYIPHYSGAAGKSDVEYHREASRLLKLIAEDIF